MKGGDKMANCFDCQYCAYGPLYDANEALPKKEGYKCMIQRINIDNPSKETKCIFLIQVYPSYGQWKR